MTTEWTAPPRARAPTGGLSIRPPLSPTTLETLTELPHGADGAPAATAVALAAGAAAPRAAAGGGTAVGDSGTARPAVATTSPAVTDADRLKAARILAADDNATNQLLLRRFLQKLGYTNITIVADGREALLQLQKQHYDLLLTDCDMPHLDGYELCRRVRADDDPALAGMPIIAITASAMPADIDRCHAAAMDDHLSKPYTATQLGAIVDKWLKRALASTLASGPE